MESRPCPGRIARHTALNGVTERRLYPLVSQSTRSPSRWQVKIATTTRRTDSDNMVGRQTLVTGQHSRAIFRESSRISTHWIRISTFSAMLVIAWVPHPKIHVRAPSCSSGCQSWYSATTRCSFWSHFVLTKIRTSSHRGYFVFSFLLLALEPYTIYKSLINDSKNLHFLTNKLTNVCNKKASQRWLLDSTPTDWDTCYLQCCLHIPKPLLHSHY